MSKGTEKEAEIFGKHFNKVQGILDEFRRSTIKDCAAELRSGGFTEAAAYLEERAAKVDGGKRDG